MRLGITRTCQLLAALLLIGPMTATADVPNGMLEFVFSGDDQIFDFGQFEDCETETTLGIEVTLCLVVDMVPNGKGKYTGIATLAFEGDIEGDLVGPASGSFKGKSSGGKGKFKFQADGILRVDVPEAPLFDFDTEIGVSCSGPVTPGGIVATICKVKLKVEATVEGQTVKAKESFRGTFDATLVGGDWTITIEVFPIDEKNKKLGGTAIDDLGNVYTVSGKYSAKKDSSKLTLKGPKDTSSKGAKIKLKHLTDTGAADAKFKVRGYKGKEDFFADD